MKKVLVSGYIGFNNFGDEAIFYALSSHLKETGFCVSALCNNKNDVEKKYNVKTYNYKSPLEIFQAILNCNILISGGGSLLQNKTSNFSLFYYLFIILFAKLFFKKVIIFAQGFEHIEGKFPCSITKTILKLTDFISVRDEKSQKFLKAWNINSILVSDPAYSLVQDREICQNKKGLIVQLRDFKNFDKNFLNLLAKGIKKHNKEEVQVFSFQDSIDEKICLDFIEILKKNNVEAQYIPQKDINETIEILNKAKYVISTRLHGLIIAHALKTNTFALQYDNKIKTLTSELNIPFVDVYNFSSSELDKKLDEFFNHHLNENHSKPHSYRRFSFDCIDNNLKN